MDSTTDHRASKPPHLIDLPNELLDAIISSVPAKTLKALRLASPVFRYNKSIVSRLFDQLRMSDSNKNMATFTGVPSSPQLAPAVRELIWYDFDLQPCYIDALWHRYHCEDFYKGLDRLVNLNMFTHRRKHSDECSSYAPGSLGRNKNRLYLTTREDPRIEPPFRGGLYNVLLPAMSRPTSKIVAFRLHTNNFHNLWPLGQGQFSSLRADRTEMPVSRWAAGCCAIYPDALKNLSAVEIFISRASWGRMARHPPEQLCYNLNSCKALEDLTLGHDPGDIPRGSLETSFFDQIPTLKWPKLHTLRLRNLEFDDFYVDELIANHADTLKHLFLIECSEVYLGLAKRLAALPTLRLHVLVVSPAPQPQNWYTPAVVVVPEAEMLEYINGKDPELIPPSVAEAESFLSTGEPVMGSEMVKWPERYSTQFRHDVACHICNKPQNE
ncbi:hypothetical protein G7046_g8365 [Stylonectria norvegica]|nr:hypothetical protein G7046_g8365 [Stylonectria norvegica]